ncbi:2-oxo acid dehydrogenase subunit E2 [Candidimonas nitroreducens]|uniref:2-oxoacid dehydrogenase acyltransferase catalytic domain-containing protein n=1 Tax=Candidimonas nitroreducens TaxID=683354 RepID=A0A225MQ99_9BURK|nr:2-oxo acid dehydrogenase subunit E2 [Candidimonas nitroreducens]OWT62100.1 hypothetical protein CEY11_09880 [Candidimonas nitroreducens]
MTGETLASIPVARRIKLAGSQKIVAERMVESLRVNASVTAMAEAPAGALLKACAQWQSSGSKAGLTHLLIHACARCLERHPRLNGAIFEDQIVEFAEINIALAVSLPDGGLQSVVIRRANEKDIPQITEEAQSLVQRARDGALKLEHVRGGTFTLSNYAGLKHVVWATPIIPPGQSGVLGVGRIHHSLAPQAGKNGYTTQETLPLSLTYDHRLINGMAAGAFLEDLIDMMDTTSLERTNG